MKSKKESKRSDSDVTKHINDKFISSLDMSTCLNLKSRRKFVRRRNSHAVSELENENANKLKSICWLAIGCNLRSRENFANFAFLSKHNNHT